MTFVLFSNWILCNQHFHFNLTGVERVTLFLNVVKLILWYIVRGEKEEEKNGPCKFPNEICLKVKCVLSEKFALHYTLFCHLCLVCDIQYNLSQDTMLNRCFAKTVLKCKV